MQEIFSKLHQLIGSTPITKYFKKDKTLRESLLKIINNNGRDLFQKEFSEKPDDFLKSLIESRNKIFHVDGNKKSTIHDIEYVLYCMKFSILYRRIIVKQLIPGFNFNTDLQKFYVKIIDEWIDNKSRLNNFN